MIYGGSPHRLKDVLSDKVSGRRSWGGLRQGQMYEDLIRSGRASKVETA